MIYLDNAATSCPKPEIVYKTMDEFLRTKGGNPGRGGHSMAIAAKYAVDEARMLVARFINVHETNRVIFCLNCTDALNLGLKGLLKPGDHVITSQNRTQLTCSPFEEARKQWGQSPSPS